MIMHPEFTEIPAFAEMTKGRGHRYRHGIVISDSDPARGGQAGISLSVVGIRI